MSNIKNLNVEELQKLIDKSSSQQAGYRIKISGRGQALILNAAAVRAFQSEGVEKMKSYISSNTQPALFAAVNKIVSQNEQFVCLD